MIDLNSFYTKSAESYIQSYLAIAMEIFPMRDLDLIVFLKTR